MTKTRAGGGFSLIELLLVLLITVILGCMMSGMMGVSHQKRVLDQCRGNLQKIYLALNFYQNDNRGAFPLVSGAMTSDRPLSLLVPKDTAVTQIFICPSSRDKALPEAESFAGRRISYAYYMGRTTNDDPGEVLASDAQADAAPKNKGQQIFSADGRKPGNNHGKDGGNLLERGGDVTASGPFAARDARFSSGVHLLNPE